MKSSPVERTVTDTTPPTRPTEREIVWHAPFDRCDREQDYRNGLAETGGTF